MREVYRAFPEPHSEEIGFAFCHAKMPEMGMPTQQAAAFILAGGKSSRMGEDKAFLRLGGRTLLEIAQANAEEVFSSVTVVGDRARFGPAAIEDVYPDCGPLGGIHAALATSKTELNLILAVDTPFVDPRFLGWMLQQAEQSGAVVTVPRSAAGFQPLCAVYRRTFKEVAEKSLQAKQYKIDALYSRVSTRIVTQDELNHLAFDPRMFDNLNTRADYERVSRTRT
jgi:molybdenum cofactor guanylyltransferase